MGSTRRARFLGGNLKPLETLDLMRSNQSGAGLELKDTMVIVTSSPSLRRTVGPAVAWDLVQTFLQAKYSQEERHLRRLAKVFSVESEGRSDFRAAESSRLK